MAVVSSKYSPQDVCTTAGTPVRRAAILAVQSRFQPVGVYDGGLFFQEDGDAFEEELQVGNEVHFPGQAPASDELESQVPEIGSVTVVRAEPDRFEAERFQAFQAIRQKIHQRPRRRGDMYGFYHGVR